MKTPEIKSPLSSAALAAGLFWLIYAVLLVTMLVSYWSQDMRLFYTGLLGVVPWAGALYLWGWRLDVQDEAGAEEYWVQGQSHGDSYYFKKVYRDQQLARRLRRRGIGFAIYAGIVVPVALTLFAIAIWHQDGEIYGYTGAILLAGLVPPAASILRD